MIPEDIRSLLDEIRQSLSPLSPSLTSTSQGSDLYEAFLLTIVIAAARAEDARISYQTSLGLPAAAFYFRTSPGHIYSTRHPYTHAVIEFANKPQLEAHVGIMVVGRSNVLHECDVAVIDRGEATACRAMNTEPASSKVRISIEAKFYSSALGLGLARAFIGLVSDLSAKHSSFVSNATSPSVVRLLASDKRRDYYGEVGVGHSATSRLQSYLQDCFVRYKDGQ